MNENNEKSILDTKKTQLKEQEEKLEALQKRGGELDETEQKLATMKEEIDRRKNSTTTKTEVAETTPVVEKEKKSPAGKKKGIKEIKKVENLKNEKIEENIPKAEETQLAEEQEEPEELKIEETPPIEKQEEQEEPEELKVETSNNNNQTNNMANEEQNFQTPRANNQVEDETISPEENISSVDNEKVGALLEPQNEGLWNKMSSKGKQIMSGVYEGIYKTPVVNRLVGKMEIAYNQFWIDKKEEKSVELKGKMDALNVRRESLSDVQKEIRNAALELEEDGIGGSAKLMIRHKGLETQKTKIEKKEDKLQGRIEKRENRISLYTNKRDAIADRLITHYEKKLSPIEGRLEVLEDKQNKVELKNIAAEVKLDEQYAKLKNLEERKIIIEKKYIAAGFTERQIGRDPVIKEIASKINNGYSNIQIEKGIIAAKRDEVNRRVAKIDKKAEPYRNRKNEFIRVKDNRPVKINLEERVEPREFKGTEETTSHTRYENPEGYNYGGETKSSQNQTEYVGSAFENMHEFSNLISNYNGLIDGVIKKDEKLSALQVDEKDLIKATKISRTSRMNTKNFARILEQYYKTKKIPESIYKNITSKLK